MTHPIRPALTSFPVPRCLSLFLSWRPPLPSSAGYLTGHPVGTELPKAQRGLDPSQQGHHIQVFDSAPAGGHMDLSPCSPTQKLPPCSDKGPRAREPGHRAMLPIVQGSRSCAPSLKKKQVWVHYCPPPGMGCSLLGGRCPFENRIPSDVGSPGLEPGLHLYHGRAFLGLCLS